MALLRPFGAVLMLALVLAGTFPSQANDLTRALELLKREDYQAAVPVLRRLAKAGDADAQAYYGGLYLVGIGGVPHDPIVAHRWLERAAAGGNATAAVNLGLMAEMGDGMLVDPVAAFRWYRKAADAGIPFAMLKVGKSLREGWGVPTSIPEAAKWLRAAAELDDPDAKNLLGVMIAGNETAGSSSEAYAWFELAARDGQPDAAKNRQLLEQQMSGEEIAEGKRRARAGRASGG